MCIFPTHVDFSKLGKCNTKATGAEGMDFLIRSGCLIAKLIAGKIQNLQAMRLVFIIYFLQFRILRGKAAAGGGIHDQKSLSLIIAKAFSVPSKFFTVKS